jgi:endonuclease G
MKRAPQAAVGLALFCALGGAGTPLPATDVIGFSHCSARYALIGLPDMEDNGIELCRTGYAVSFNPDNHVPNWVIEHLTPAQLTGSANRKDNFKKDPQATGSADPADYKGQPFDRGHQAPAADFKSSQQMTDESFWMTNMAPQVGVGFNRHIWRYLETDVRNWVACDGMTDLYVITGPVYGDTAHWMGTDKAKRVRIPDKFFKVIFDPKHGRALGMLLDNKKLDPADLPNYAVAIRDIEEATGITFFPNLSKRQQNVLKASKGNLWGVDENCSVNVDE